MADTANYGWTKPTVNADENDWGDILNTALDDIDADLDAVDDRVDTLETAAGTSAQDADGSGSIFQRIAGLRGKEQYGPAGCVSSLWVLPDTAGPGGDVSSTAISQGDMFFVPVTTLGAYDAMYVENSNAFTLAGVYDMTEDGDIGDLLVEAEHTSGDTRACSVTLVRPAWIGVLFLQSSPTLFGRGSNAGAFKPILGVSGSIAYSGGSFTPVRAYRKQSVTELPDPGPTSLAAYTGLGPNVALRTA